MGGPVPPPGRPLEAAGNRRPRWMAVPAPALARGRDRIPLTGPLSRSPTRWAPGAGVRVVRGPSVALHDHGAALDDAVELHHEADAAALRIAGPLGLG